MNSNKEKIESLKENAAKRAAAFIQNGMLVGLGTGSTATCFIRELGRRIREENLSIRSIATSKQSADLAQNFNIPLMENFPETRIDITVDGADEIDPNLGLIKGLGGALLMEKIIALQSKMEIIIADEGKLVTKLGSKCPVPVEVVKFGFEATRKDLINLGFTVTLRLGKDNNSPFVTDQGNFILDCLTGPIDDPRELNRKIKMLTGVVDHGLFLDLAHLAIIARHDGIEEIRAK